MNWVVNKVNKIITEDHDHCEHLTEGERAPCVIEERDSFGMVGAYAMCKECYEKHQEEQAEELEYCHDCKENKPMKEMISWTPYDYYPPQGDEPLFICSCCVKLPKHQERVARDKRNREYELGY